MVSRLDNLPRVVVADDHPSVLAALASMLRGSCEVVATVPTGSDAIDAVLRFRPDVLVVDLMMPDMDGLEVCRCVTLAVPDIEVVIVTAFADPSVEHVALRDGAAAFLAKHDASRTLVATIRRLSTDRQPRATRLAGESG